MLIKWAAAIVTFITLVAAIVRILEYFDTKRGATAIFRPFSWKSICYPILLFAIPFGIALLVHVAVPKTEMEVWIERPISEEVAYKIRSDGTMYIQIEGGTIGVGNRANRVVVIKETVLGFSGDWMQIYDRINVDGKWIHSMAVFNSNDKYLPKIGDTVILQAYIIPFSEASKYQEAAKSTEGIWRIESYPKLTIDAVSSSITFKIVDSLKNDVRR